MNGLKKPDARKNPAMKFLSAKILQLNKSGCEKKSRAPHLWDDSCIKPSEAKIP